MCRFINADEVDNLAANGDYASLNLFAYCGNNPVVRKDDGGAFWNFVAGAAVGAFVGMATTFINELKANDGDWGKTFTGNTMAKVAVSGICGAINGTVAASGIGMLGAGLVGGLTGGLESMCHKLIDNGGTLDAEDGLEIIADAGAGFLGGLAGGKGAIKGDKYMANQLSRFKAKILPTSLAYATQFFKKSTAQYSIQFIKPTLQGITRGWVTSQVVDHLATKAISQQS